MHNERYANATTCLLSDESSGIKSDLLFFVSLLSMQMGANLISIESSCTFHPKTDEKGRNVNGLLRAADGLCVHKAIRCRFFC